jgi:hypothetical protein
VEPPANDDQDGFSDDDNDDADEPPDRPAMPEHDGGGNGGLDSRPPAVPIIAFHGASASSGSDFVPALAVAPVAVMLARAVALVPVVVPAQKGRNEVRYAVGTGFVLKNEAGLSLDAHCEVCGCAINRKSTAFKRAKAPKTLAQGRPMGLLLSWLAVECTGDTALHRATLGLLGHDVRLAARVAACTELASFHLFAAERGPNEGDVDGEPSVAP